MGGRLRHDADSLQELIQCQVVPFGVVYFDFNRLLLLQFCSNNRMRSEFPFARFNCETMLPQLYDRDLMFERPVDFSNGVLRLVRVRSE